MQRTDKLLFGIVIGIVALVIAAFAVLLLRPRLEYVADDTPEHIVHNYLLALQREDYDRAYGYLQPDIAGYPRSVDRFRADINQNQWQFNIDQDRSTFEIAPAAINATFATVRVTQRVFYGEGLFGSSYDSDFSVSLRQAGPAWKITESDQFWYPCWSDRGSC